ncbi:MAG: DNA helicase [Firmicutes bacterium]|nr:DNA helicase [Bacillota bacterium]
MADKHYDYHNEKRYLELTIEALDNEIEYLKDVVQNSEEEVASMKKKMGGNYSDELVVKLTIFDSYRRKLKMLGRAKNKPYFGRIDFKELEKDKFESFYIGKTSITRRNDEKRFVIDWRTPMAGLYYSGEIGDVMYNAPGGLILGELKLKRQYEIENRELVNIFDKGLTPMDEYLQEALWEKKDNRLRDIVTTIQGEQNDIIRADDGKVIIVQGVAGSGKTTIVLHRIAYLMYTYQEVFTPEKLLIVVPNNLFLNYISDVLPDLGVEEINQSTFEDLAMEILEERLELNTNEEKFYKLLSTENQENEYNRNLKYSSSLKGSLEFKDILDRYIISLTKEMAPKRGFEINNYTIFSQKEMEDMFNSQYSYLPVIPRIERIKKYIKDNIKSRIDIVKEEINKKYNKQAKKVKNSEIEEEKIRETLIEIYDERDEIKETFDKERNTVISNYFKEFTNINVMEAYESFITDRDKINRYSSDHIPIDKIDFIAEYTKNIIDSGKIEREDLPALLYLYMKLHGTDLKGRYNHIVVDEAQDYSPFQMYILRELSSNKSFTIVGDLSQGIHSYKGINSWDGFMEEVFKEDSIEFLTLKKCYRSTMEIMNFANEVIKKWHNKNITLAEPVLRSGDKPFILKKKDEENIIDDICLRFDELSREGHKSIAVICKDNHEAHKIYKALKDKHSEDIHLITDKDTVYDGGIVVIPAYMAKGLEFDAVLVYDCSKDKYSEDELNIKLLYVALTRPLHKLYIYYINEPSSLIQVNEEVYNRE